MVVFVSREMLEENFPFFEAPLDSLARAVLNAMRPDSPSKAFAPIRQRLTVWEKSSRSLVPPILPLVALTVAAAADMGADERGGPLMYYGRLQEILGEPITAQQLSNSFEDVAWMWRTLSQWITEQQWLGPSTILEDTHLSRIGFARSQAVISKQDAANLRDFFFSIGRGKLDDLTPRQLLSELMRWNRKFKRLSRVLTRSLEGDQTGPEMKLLASVMPLLARKWDGQPKEHQSQAQLRVQIRLDLDAWTARWVVPRRQGIDALDVVDASGRELSLRSVGVGGFYRSTGLPDSVASSIDSSHKWSTADVRIQMKPRKVWMFAVDAVSGDWVSTNVLEPFDEIALLIREDQTEDFCGILDAVGVQGYKRIGGSRQIVNGWDLFLRVNLSDNADDTRIIEWLGYGRASVEESAESPRLVNGLRVRSHSGVEVYVAGGEPDLVVPATPFGTYSISLDGSDEMELRANGSALPLHKLVTPDPASHFLFINDSHILEFETIAVDDPNLVPANNLMEPVTGRNLVSVDTGRERIVLARSADHWTVTRHGTITKIVAPKIPEWLSNAGYTNEYRFDAEVPADAVWLVTVRRDAIRSIKKLGTADVELNLDGMGASEAEWKFLSRDEGLVQRGADWLNVVYQARRLLRF
ncbi:hypothetical protein TV39_04745 [Arthrobacter sp. SPG23]|nr:hypothetical protein TV39_04745 [Arthrobacter sp. SPG23]